MAHCLIDGNRHTAIEVSRGPKWAHLVRFGTSPLRLSHEAVEAVDKEFQRHDDITAAYAAVMFVGSLFPVSERAFKSLSGIIRSAQTQEQQMATIDVKKASLGELVAFYNTNAPEGTPKVKRFNDRIAAERRCDALMLQPEPTTPDATKEDEMKKTTKTKTVKAAKTAKEIAAAVSATWRDKEIAAARSTKSKVKVGGEIYRSVAAAFTDLKLNFNKHAAFRKLLKEQGRATFEGNVFTLVKEEE